MKINANFNYYSFALKCLAYENLRRLKDPGITNCGSQKHIPMNRRPLYLAKQSDMKKFNREQMIMTLLVGAFILGIFIYRYFFMF